MSSPRFGNLTSPSPRPGTPCSDNGMEQSTSPISQSSLSSPIPSDAADCPTSDCSDSGSFCSRAPTPQCLPLDDNMMIPENGAISQEEKYQFMDFVQRLIVDAQGQAATPCSGLHPLPDPNTELETTTLEDFRQPQSSVGFDWERASTMTLDQLPDSNLWYSPEYKLTEEWLARYLNEVEPERQVDQSADICAEVERHAHGCTSGAWSDS